MNKTFYDQTKLLDLYKSDQNPSPDQIHIVLTLVREEKFARYFFEGLENPVWVTPLYQNGFFYKVPEPIEVEPGSFQLPGWPAGVYLARFADRYEEIAINVIKSTRTENWRVHELLIDILLKISPASASSLISSIDSWLSGRFSGMLPIKLASLADHFRENGFVDAAIQMLELVITPILPPVVSDSKYRSPVRFRADHYWVGEYCKNQIVKLTHEHPLGIVKAFQRELERAIELTKKVNPDDAEFRAGYLWRIDIPNRFSDREDADALDILIDGLRGGLTELCKQSIINGQHLLKTYLSSEHLIFQRIALYILRIFGKDYPDLINQALLSRSYLESSEYANEYRGILRSQFSTASEDTREQVIAWILAGPSDVDSRAIRHAQWENRETTDDDRRKVRDEWTLYHLQIIKEYMYGEDLSRYNELTALYGEPNVEERPAIVTATWGGAPSPVPESELAKKSFDELKQLFLTYVPIDLFLNPRESLGQSFQRLVREDPNRYSPFAAYLTDPFIRFVYIYHFLSGIRESVKNKNGKLRDEIIELCGYVVNEKIDPFEGSSGKDEPGLFAAQMEVARLLEEALRSDDPYLTRKQLNQIRKFLIELAHHPNPEKDDDGESSFDPFTRSLNCVRGEALHGIIHYSLYLVRQQEKQRGEKQKSGYLEPEIRKILEEKLDLEVEPSLAVHSVYGAFVPQLFYLSREWLEQQLTSIFPEPEERFAYWRAAWDAYIFSSNLYRDVFNLLIPHYQRGLKLLSQSKEEQKFLSGSPNERLAQHLMNAYISGLTDFGHENFLLDLYFSNAPDSVRANGIFWLSMVLENARPSAEDVLWKKCWVLWQKRLENAETQGIHQNTQEISDYVRWLDISPVGLDFLYPTLFKTVKYLNLGFYARNIIEYAAKNCERFPREAVTLLQMIILSIKERWWMSDDKDEEKILRAAIGSYDKDAKRIALEVVNYRGEQGDFRWKYLIA